MNEPLIDLRSVAVVLDGRKILGPLSWQIKQDENWVVLGPNGGGKSTLLRICSLMLHPSQGSVRVLGHELGKVDVRSLKARIGLSSSSLADQLRGRLTAGEVVMCGLHAALEPWWHSYGQADAKRATELLADVGLVGYQDRSFGTLSSGERQRALLARTLMPGPEVVLLDEPNAGLDLAGREALVLALDSLAKTNHIPTVLVTHHVEDIPSSTTHLLAITEGQVAAAGPIAEVLTADLLSEMYFLPVDLSNDGGRWAAKAQPSSD